MTYSVPRCDHAGCPGHLGKFQDCQSEALYEITLDSFGDRDTGDVEFEGHFSLIELDSDYIHEFADATQGVIVIPAGAYIVQSTNSGAVYTWREDSAEAANALMDQVEQDYSAYLDQDEDDV